MRFEDDELTALQDASCARTRPRLQMIFQDPISSLNPRRKVGDIVGEGLDIWARRRARSARRRRSTRCSTRSASTPTPSRDRRPHEFSGGQCQRICIARALVIEPKLIICDEPVSALDVSVQAQILNLLEDMKARYGLTMVFIAHDLAVVKNVSDRVAVMYLGQAVRGRLAPTRSTRSPRTPTPLRCSRRSPNPTPRLAPDVPPPLVGEIPSNINPPSGCRFRTRCPRAEDRCAMEEPEMREVSEGQFVACHFPLSPGEPLAPPPALGAFDLA